MRKKENNNLICVEVNNEKFYYTSMTRAANKLNVACGQVQWALLKGVNPTLPDGTRTAKVTLVDGSDIPYKLINN